MKKIHVEYRLVYSEDIEVEDEEFEESDIRDIIDEHWNHVLVSYQPEYDSVEYEVEE